MRKLKRRKVIKEYLESQIEKNQRRIQTLAATNFELRKQLEALKALPVNKPLTKVAREELEKAKQEALEPVMDSADQEIGVSSEAN